MSLSDGLIVLSLACLAYGVVSWAWRSYGPTTAAPTVKHSPPQRAFKPRSRRSNVQNAVNAGSGQHDAKQEPVNVQAFAAALGAPGAPAGAPGAAGDGFTLTTREMIQLAEALHVRAEGATVEQAVSKAFGVTKGAGEGWKRGKALFDAATALPGDAPAGTYAVMDPGTRSRRRRAPVAR